MHRVRLVCGLASLVLTGCLPRPATRVKAAFTDSDPVCDASAQHPTINGYADANKLNLVFCDSFSGDTLNSKNWVTNFDWGSASDPNGERTHEVSFDLDAYFDSSLVKVSDGQLHLNAVNQANPASTKGAKWTSSAVTGHFQFMYGYIEARIRAPDTKGMWPAFWLTFPFRWPPEVDIMELRTDRAPNGDYGSLVNVNYIYGPSWDNKSSSYLELGRDDLQRVGLCDQSEASCGKKFTEFQTYAVAWQPDSLDYFYNGTKVYSVAIQDEPRNRVAAILLNLAVGGWAQKPDDKTDWSKAHLDIDWVRIWEFPAAPTVLKFADGSSDGTTAPTPPGPQPSAPSGPAPVQAQPSSKAGSPACPPGNDGSGRGWCDCYLTDQCWPWCTKPGSGDWGYQPELGGAHGSCHNKP